MPRVNLVKLANSLKEQFGSVIVETPDKKPVASLDYNLQLAKQEWDNAKNFFNHAIDSDLIDSAIYQMEAAERKYMHLLKLIKSERQQEI